MHEKAEHVTKHTQLRVGIPQELDAHLRSFFPPGAELVRVPDALDQPISLDFWILPYMTTTLEQVQAYVRGVQVVQTLSAGVDAVLGGVPAGATLCDGRGIHDIPVAEWVVGVVLSSFKYLQLFEDVRRREEWKARFETEEAYLRLHPAETKQALPVLGEDLAGKHVLIVGYGSIGEAIEKRLTPFEVTISRVSRRARAGVWAIGDLDTLLPQADVVVLIVPLTGETTGLFGRERLGRMKQGALLVNAARGPVVETEALVELLGQNRIRAALDVTEPEPLPAGHPLWRAPNLLLTPHIAGGGPNFATRAYRFAGEQVARFMRGEPLLNVVSEGY